MSDLLTALAAVAVVAATSALCAHVVTGIEHRTARRREGAARPQPLEGAAPLREEGDTLSTVALPVVVLSDAALALAPRRWEVLVTDPNDTGWHYRDPAVPCSAVRRWRAGGLDVRILRPARGLVA